MRRAAADDLAETPDAMPVYVPQRDYRIHPPNTGYPVMKAGSLHVVGLPRIYDRHHHGRRQQRQLQHSPR